MKNGNTPAMPVTHDSNDVRESHQGLTKREMFAMHAMQALLSDSDYAELYDTRDEWISSITKNSCELADALLKELEK